MNKRTTPWLLLVPALLITGLYVLFPVAQALSMSLHYVNLFHPRTRPFVGLTNDAQRSVRSSFLAKLA